MDNFKTPAEVLLLRKKTSNSNEKQVGISVPC